MYVRGARIAVATLSGLALVGTLAGCGVQTVDATVTGPGDGAKTAVPAAVKPTQSATPAPTATAAPAIEAKPTVAPVKPVVAEPVPTTPPTVTPSASPSSSPDPTSTYKDGNYSATGTYNSPGGRETLRVTLDLSNDRITALEVTSVKIDSTAAAYEAAFEGGIQSIVVGRDIDGLAIGPVAGSSLTSIGFNKALTAIRALAKA